MHYIVYKTTNLINDKEYIGIHQTNNLEDGYLGSGLAMSRAIKKYGKENFKREILEFCSSYDELLIKETLLVDETWVNDEHNYNLKTGGQSAGLLSDESKAKISNTLKHKYKVGELIARKTAPYTATDKQKQQISETLKEKYKKIEHHRKNKESWNKGKTGLQTAWNKGLKTLPMREEQKNKISETLRVRHAKGEIKTNKGVEPWNKGKTGVQKAWNKGLIMEKLTCPNCGKLVDVGNSKRWHFDKCKLKQW